VKVIPVIDLKGGEVVRGVGGRREDYRRVETTLTDDASPGGIVRAFVNHFAVDIVYVADLDAIAGGTPDFAAYTAIGRSGAQLWVDAGAGEVRRAAEIAAYRDAEIATVIVGLESLASPAELAAIIQRFGAERIVFSLDLKDGRPITRVASWIDEPPERIAEDAVYLGVTRMIVLDLAHVGEGRGPGAAPRCRALHDRFPRMELIGGGGVRSLADARDLAAAGCNAVLIASALHDGRLSPRDVAEIESI
jgi:phosphoribosylformimino-5-aminoimidazole carboxamide ribotide isomerase